MAEPEDINDEVKIFAPDKSLQVKIGVTNLDQIFSPQVVAAAQNVIVQAADQFLDACLEHMKEIEDNATVMMQSQMLADRHLHLLVDAALAMKAKAGLGGYDLVSALAKSLHLYCEAIPPGALTARHTGIIQWHVASLKMLLTRKVKGNGGATGAAIMAEVEKLAKG